jgi:hypothetical protein
MNPREKAKELFEKYYVELKEHNGFYDLETAKQCVIIAVDEIIKTFRKDLPKIGLGKGFWAEVKQEINNL